LHNQINKNDTNVKNGVNFSELKEADWDMENEEWNMKNGI